MGLPRIVVAGVIVFAILGLIGEALIFTNYLQINQTVRPSFTRGARLLPRLSSLRSSVLQLHAETIPLITSDIPDFRRVDVLRPEVEQRLADLRQEAGGLENYAAALGAADNLLLVWDRQMEILHAGPDVPERAVMGFELQRAFDFSQTTLADLSATEEQGFYSTTDQAFLALGNIQGILLGLGVLIAGVGALLFVILRRSVRSEIDRAYDRLQVAADVGRAASSILDVGSLLAQVVELIRDRFGYDHVSVFLLDDAGEKAVLREATGEAGARLKAAGHALAVGSQSIIGWVTENRRVRLAGDVSADPVHFKNEARPETRSELALPLIAGERLLGALDVQSRSLNAFVDVDVRALQALTDQIAIAIANASEYGTQQARSQKLSALSQAALQLAEPQPTQAALLDLAARRAMAVVNADGAAIWLPAAGRNDEIELKVWYRGQSIQPPGRRLPMNQGVVGRIWAGSQPVQVEGSADGLPGRGGAVSAGLAVPMAWQSGVTGLLVLARFRPGARFNEEDRNVARLLASQVAAAIENFRLIAESQARVAELFSLNQLSTALTREAPADLGQAMKAAAKQMQNLFGVDGVSIVLLDPDGGTPADGRYPMNDYPLIRQALEDHEMAVVESVGQDTRLGEAARQDLLRRGVQAVAFVPLVVAEFSVASQRSEAAPSSTGERALGFAALETLGGPRRFTEAETNLCRTVAAQLAIAVQNTRLFEQNSRRARRERLINEITGKIRRAVDVRSVLATTANELGQALGASRARVEVSPASDSPRGVTLAAATNGGSHTGRNGQPAEAAE